MMNNYNIVTLLLWAIILIHSASAEVVPFLDQGFMFDYTPKDQPIQIPVTQQCETIHLEWGRSTATGPNPVAPYSFQVYTSTYILPFIIDAGSSLSFDWPVPFAPGTQYQICMSDSQGTTGGCQAMYSVVQNTTTQTPSCQNMTFAPQMDIVGTVAGGGPLSQYGFIDQCTDVSITPKNGTPPFTLTVAPALHPPYIITSNTLDPIVWTVSMSRGMPFFMSLVSSDGFMWQNGPMHSGGNGPTDCLAPGTVPTAKARAVAAGAGVGGAFATALLIAAAVVFWRYREHRRDGPLNLSNTIDPLGIIGKPARWGTSNPESAPYPGLSTSNPFDDRTRLRSDADPFTHSSSDGPARRARSQVYVVHQDAGRAEVAEVVDLPPGYIASEQEQGSDVPPPLPEKSGR